MKIVEARVAQRVGSEVVGKELRRGVEVAISNRERELVVSYSPSRIPMLDFEPLAA